MEVAVLGHRGMLGSVVARYFAQRKATVWTTDLRYDGSDELPEWAARFDLVVNCIKGGWRENADLPVHLGLLCQKVISPSTDAINEDTDYAAQKREAEKARAIIIRAGIVDTTRQPAAAFTKWLCNPLTPLEWAQVAYHLREAKPHVYQLGRETLSRYDVARLVAQAFGTPEPTATDSPPLNRVVASKVHFPPLDVALAEYRAWLDRS